jgi:hypothetical protein
MILQKLLSSLADALPLKELAFSSASGGISHIWKVDFQRSNLLKNVFNVSLTDKINFALTLRDFMS